MRFAWLRNNSTDDVSVKESFTNRLTHVAYNAVWWIPIVLVIIGTIDYNTGFILFAVITIGRSGANLYRNNVLEPEQAHTFPFRS